MNRRFKALMRRHRGLTLAILLMLLAGALAGPATPIATAAPAAQGCRTLPETGFSVCGRFLQFWSQNGGLPVFGYPISSEQGGIQFFERNRFEAHPENRFPYDVLLGRLGAEAKGQTPPAPKDDGVERLVQGFERGVFRAFDENQPPYTVQLDLLGQGACTAARRC